MSGDHPRPRVALPYDVVERLPDAVRDAVDILEFRNATELANAGADAGVGDVRFLATGPWGHPILEHLPEYRRLEVLQTASAGTDWVGPLPAQITLCSARGARDAPVAEWIIGALLGASSHLLARAGATEWETLKLRDLGDWTVLVVGMGSIGRRLEAYLEPFGTGVIGVASHARDDLHGIDELTELLPSADAVVLLTPLTDDTRHLISGAELAAMRDGAVLINAARGGVVDTDALVAELQRGRIQAVLDVTDPEPLAAGHPLWDAPGLLAITPHIAGDSEAGRRGAAQLAADQLGRWLSNQPLHNVVVRPDV